MADDDTGKDHLDRETSLSVDLTETGITAKAKSRAVAAIDRLIGNLGEWANVRIEDGNTRRRLAIEARQRIGTAAIDALVKETASDPELARRAITNILDKAAEQQANLEGVARAAVEDLRSTPPTEDEAQSGPEELGKPFQDRFEFYAREASSEELREHWGRVLASEIRKPGTFSGKALRVVDELDADIAVLFERVCADRIQEAVPTALVGELTFGETQNLVTADLIVDPGLVGQVIVFSDVGTASQERLWLLRGTKFGVGVLQSAIPTDYAWPEPELFMNHNGKPATRSLVLTKVGTAIACILPDREEETAGKIAERLQAKLPAGSVQVFKRADSGWRIVSGFRAP